jgi:hypothetical protein
LGPGFSGCWPVSAAVLESRLEDHPDDWSDLLASWIRGVPETIRWELAFFPFELVDLLFQLGGPLQGIAMATLAISGLLAKFAVLSFETLDFGAEVSALLAQSRHQGDQLQGGIAGATDLDQLAIDDQPGLPRMDQRGRR